VGNPAPDSPSSISRRAALAIIVGAGVAACTPAGEPSPDASSTSDTDALTRSDVAAQEWMLVAMYDAAIAAQPSKVDELTSLRDQHIEHAQALGSAAPGGSASPVSAAPDRAQLVAAELQASRDRVTACSRAAQPDLARLLALIGASEAGHAAFLKDGAP